MTLLSYTRRCEKECLFYRLLDACEEHGWSKLGLGAWIKSRRLRHNGFQEIAVRVLVWGGIIAPSERIKGSIMHEVRYRGREFAFIFGRGDVHADAAFYQTPRCMHNACINRDDIIARLPPRPEPLIVIDLTQLPEHNLDEAGSLRRQLAATLGVIRSYLWDRHLLLTNTPPGARAWLHSFMHSDYVQVSSLPTDDALDARGYEGPRILLDPNAREPLKPHEVLEAQVFILGGIVDKRPRPGATMQLPIKKAVRRRIELRGSIIGVPHTLNNLVETILLARYKYNGSIERALYDTIPPHEARIRAYVEIARAARGKGVVSWELYKQLKQWLPLRPRDFEKAARMAGVRLVGEERVAKVSKDQSHHDSQR